MGWLLIDNRNAPSEPGIPNTKTEYETRACAHCGGVIAILARGCNQFSLSSIDVAVATGKAHEVGEKYVGKYSCHRCHAPICRRCSAVMHLYCRGECPGPFKARLERAMSKQRRADEFVYHYKSTSR